MARPTPKELELLDVIDGLQARIRQLQEAISPGRIANHEYYIGVARRFRESASAKHKDTIGLEWTPMRPTIPENEAICGSGVLHGVNCKKEPHVRSGMLHGEDDDTPYDVDGVKYCGRCHWAI